jgi:hypothetical protein
VTSSILPGTVVVGFLSVRGMLRGWCLPALAVFDGELFYTMAWPADHGNADNSFKD